MSRWIERALAAVLTLAIAVACDPLATNNSSITVESISDLGIPSPSVVVGQIMKDSLGNDAPLSLTAFDPKGRALLNQPIFITVLDPSVHVDQLGFVHGVTRDTIGARVIAGAGSLQTLQNRIIVTVPAQITTKSASQTAITFTVATDSTNKTNWSPLLISTATDVNGVGAQGFIVKYTVIRSPLAQTTGAPTVYIADDNGKATTRDTTDHLGVASRLVVLRQAAIGDAALLGGTKTDTIIVRATASYAGAVLPGMPIDFIIPVKKGP